MTCVEDLGEFDVSIERGFVTDYEPLTQLPAYFQPWENIVRVLPELIQEKSLRQKILQMPLLDHNRLKTVAEVKQANYVLSFLSHAYVYAEGEEGVVKVIPRNLAIPWVAVSSQLGLPAVLTHSSCVLQNWRLIDREKPMELSNLDTQFTFLGGESAKHEKIFFLYTLMIELKAAKGIKAIRDGQKAVTEEDTQELSRTLMSLRESILEMKEVLISLSDNLDVGVFYSKLRIFLSGWKNNTALPDGIIYEGVSTEPKQFSGGSAAESSIIPTFDVALGIEHPSQSGTDQRPSFLQSMRAYMPAPHRKFIEAVSHGPSIRRFVQMNDNIMLKNNYQRCVDALLNFRSTHIRVVARFVTIPASKGRISSSKALAKRGTGGTGIMPFLKALRDETQEASHV